MADADRLIEALPQERDMLARIMLALLLVSTVTPAMALDTCFGDSIGPWQGPVWNGIGLETMDTDFTVGPDGGLVGRYRIHDAVPFDGTLTDFHPVGSCEAEFTWHDRDGTGTVHIRFEPELGRFVGRWGADAPVPSLVFNGYRYRPDVVS